MLSILRLLNPDEARQVAIACGGRAGAAPEEVIRNLSRLCGATTWGIFPAGREEVLLDHAGRRLGLPPLGSEPVRRRERDVLASYLRRAWSVASPDRRREVLSLAVSAWDDLAVPCPPVRNSEEGIAGLEALLQRAAGCRALAVAAGAAPLPLPFTGTPGPFLLAVAARAATGHQALYAVLLVLWRAAARVLRERRAQRIELERQAQHLEALLTTRFRNLAEVPVPWHSRPVSGFSVTAAAALSAGLHLALAAGNPAALLPAAAVGAAGMAWSVAAALAGPHPASDPRIARLHGQIESLRAQALQAERDIRELEAE